MTLIDPRTGHTGTLATIDQLTDFTAAWLANRGLSENTCDAYRRDVRQYLAWCQTAGLDPLAVHWTHINAYARHLERTPAHPKTGKPFTKRSVARKLSAVSSWYAFLRKMGAVQINPVDDADKPKIERNTEPRGFPETDAAAILAAAHADQQLGPLCAVALAQVLVHLGARASELCLTTVADIGYHDGINTLALRQMKGRKARVRGLPPAAYAAVAAMLAARPDAQPDDPLFINATGQPLDRHAVYRFVRRAARTAGLPNASKITPHSFRHAWAAAARRAQATLEDRQFALGHADPRTTQGYDKVDVAPAADPSHRVAAAIAKAAQ